MQLRASALARQVLGLGPCCMPVTVKYEETLAKA